MPPDESGEQAVPLAEGSAGSSSQCLVRDARARLTDDEFWADVFSYREGPNFFRYSTPFLYSTNPADYYDAEGEDSSDDWEVQALIRPCTECGELVCGTDMMGRPLYHRQAEEID
jgi:hypothetical protein